VNGGLVAAFTVTNSFTEINVNTYIVVANTLGNANYIASSNTLTYSITSGNPTLTLSVGNSILYGVIDILTATGNPSSDSTNIIIGTTQVASTSGAASTYSICGAAPTIYNCQAIGTYTVQGCDTTGNICVSNVLVISANTPILTFTVFPASYTYNGQGAQVQAQVKTISNQITASLYLTFTFTSNTLRGTSNTVFNEVTPNYIDTYTYTWNTLTTGNYLSATLSKSFTISNSVGSNNNVASNVIIVPRWLPQFQVTPNMLWILLFITALFFLVLGLYRFPFGSYQNLIVMFFSALCMWLAISIYATPLTTTTYTVANQIANLTGSQTTNIAFGAFNINVINNPIPIANNADFLLEWDFAYLYDTVVLVFAIIGFLMNYLGVKVGAKK